VSVYCVCVCARACAKSCGGFVVLKDCAERRLAADVGGDGAKKRGEAQAQQGVNGGPARVSSAASSSAPGQHRRPPDASAINTNSGTEGQREGGGRADAVAEVANALLALVEASPDGQVAAALLCSSLYRKSSYAKAVVQEHQGLKGFLAIALLQSKVKFVADQVRKFLLY
jgi:hypothetical protein